MKVYLHSVEINVTIGFFYGFMANYHKLTGLKYQKYIIFLFHRLEV